MALWSGLGVSGGAVATATAAIAVAVAGAMGLGIFTEPPAPEVAEPAVVAPTPEPTPAPAETPDLIAPSLTLVRIDPQGNAVLAGQSEPGGQVIFALEGADVFETAPDSSGAFVGLFTLPPSPTPRVLRLRWEDGTGRVVPGAASLVIDPIVLEAPVVVATAPARPALTQTQTTQDPADTLPGAIAAAPTPPRVLRASADGIEILQGAPEVTTDVGLDTISYDAAGDVVLAGRSPDAGFIRVYLDNRPLGTTPIGIGGDWRAALPDIDTGIYTLRIDALDPEGQVVSRVETPFERTAPEVVAEVVARSDQADVSVITVQPGFTLWGIAQDRMGDGRKFVQVFEANRDLIRNPDLIYPGQVFTMPRTQ